MPLSGSGEYKQTKRTLRNKHGYCCLGVLCDVYDKLNQADGWEKTGSTFTYQTNSNCLPRRVRAWAGLHHLPDPNIANHAASELNDELGYTFPQIADEIEKHL